MPCTNSSFNTFVLYIAKTNTPITGLIQWNLAYTMLKMKQNYYHESKILFAVTFLVCLYWLTGLRVNVYEYAFVGAIFELLFLPMALLFIVLPIVAVWLLTMQRFSLRNLSWYALLMQLFTLIIWRFLY